MLKTTSLLTLSVLPLAFNVACSPAAEPAPPKPPLPPSRTSPPAAGEHSATALPPQAAATARAAEKPPPSLPKPDPCPAEMVYVDTVHCEQVARRCLKEEYEKANKLTICHKFKKEPPKCLSPPRRQRFCIDRYEYPSKKGAHPPVHVSAFDAAAMCREQGKRLCFESEWTAACEGPDKLPFPAGYERSSEICNIDNIYIGPSLKLLSSGNAQVRDRELRRLDQSVPSGSKERCKSGFGVYDLTGNFDEWVFSERERGISEWSGLKGGAWGHVRNACRPITVSHVPQFIYYFVSFRCCRDPDPAGVEPVALGDDRGPPLWQHPPVPNPVPLGAKYSRGWTP